MDRQEYYWYVLIQNNIVPVYTLKIKTSITNVSEKIDFIFALYGL